MSAILVALLGIAVSHSALGLEKRCSYLSRCRVALHATDTYVFSVRKSALIPEQGLLSTLCGSARRSIWEIAF